MTVFLLSVLLMGIMTSCKEDINMEDRFTATDWTILSFLENQPDEAQNFTEYVRLLHIVRISDLSESTVAQLLASRGTYTCFAPDNQAIQDYLNELHEKGIISSPSWDGFTSATTLDSIQKVIVYNSILDGTSSDQMIEMGDIISQNDLDEFTLPNLNDRRLYKIEKGNNSYFINGIAEIDLKNRDIKTINGRIHQVHAVIAPSNDTMSDLLNKYINEGAKGFLVMAKLIKACGLDDTLSKTRDGVWDTKYKRREVKDLPTHPSANVGGTIPQSRKYGFTIFAEPDAYWEGQLGKPYDQITVQDIKGFLIGKVYPDALTDDDYANENNIINQFVTYHILPEKLTTDKLVIHYNEYGYSWKTTKGQYTIPVYEYYTTMGKRRLLKIFQSKESQASDPDGDIDAGSRGIYLNRFPKLRNGRGDFNDGTAENNDYHESGEFKDAGTAKTWPGREGTRENIGVKIRINDGDGAEMQPMLNCCIYPIDDILVYTENVQNRLAGERIRIDMAAMFPEMINNDLRRPIGNYPYGETKARAFPFEYQYLQDVDMTEETQFFYLSGYDYAWHNYQMDEFNIVGQYEFTLRLPPVPKKGHYEIRFGVSAASNLRSMCQVYFGTNPLNLRPKDIPLPAKDIPMDLRIGFVNHHLRKGNIKSNFGYTSSGAYAAEASLSLEEQDEITKRLRARGFMKGPKYFVCSNEASLDLGLSGLGSDDVSRRIMVSEDMDPDKTYYIRFKNVLGDTELQFFMDYFEIVSKDVYDNPVEPEDIW